MRPRARPGGRPRGALGLPLGPAAGTGGVLLLLVLVMVLRGGDAGRTEFARIDDPLRRLAPLPAGAPAGTADDAPPRLARAIAGDLDRRWSTALEPAGARWAPLGVPLAPGLVRDLARAPGPRGLALAHALARQAAGRVQDGLGISAAVERAIADDPPVEANLRGRLARQAECLAGVYLGAAYGRDALTPARARALAGGPAPARALLLGGRAPAPGACAAFQPR